MIAPRISIIALLFGFLPLLWAEDRPPISMAERPVTWPESDGLVMAGSWHTPAHRARMLGAADNTLPENARNAYRREQSLATIQSLKKLGVNVVWIPCFEGYGTAGEKTGMDDAVQFAALAHSNGMRVGVWMSAAVADSMQQEMPETKEWVARTLDGAPILIDPNQPWRFAAARSNPTYKEYLKKLLRFAVQRVKADFITLDGTSVGSMTCDTYSTRLFEEYILDRGFTQARRLKPPTGPAPDERLWTTWLSFCQTNEVSWYREMSRYARSLNAECAIACNIGGVRADSSSDTNFVDHADILAQGQGFWAEQSGTGISDGRPVTRIRSIKTGIAFNNAALLTCETPLDVAESMAFGRNCLGMIAWFEGGDILSGAFGKGGAVSPYLEPYVKFYRSHIELYRRSTRAPDIAVLRTQGLKQASADEKNTMWSAEQALIESQTPFSILYDQVDSLDQYRAILVPEDRRLGTETRAALDKYRLQGGEVLTATTLVGDPQRARERLGNRLRVQINAPASVAAEVSERREVPAVLVHLVNYNVQQPAKTIPITIRPLRTNLPLRAEYYDPLAEKPVSLPVERVGNDLKVIVPRLNIYGLVVVSGALL